MSRKRILILVFLVIVLTAGGFGLQWVSAAYQRPLAASLALDVQPSPTAVEITGAESAAVETPVPTQAPTTCGKSGVITVLVVGSNEFYGTVDSGADLIRFVRIDFDNKTVRLIAIPDDIWVETPHLAALNLENSRLGIVYVRVERATSGTATQIDTAATSAVAQALYDNYGVAADYYIHFDMQYVVNAIDLLGGLDINIPAYISDAAATFSPGQQHLDGMGVFHYSRMLPSGGGEIVDGWDRMDRQNLVVKALIAKLLEPTNIVKIPGLIQQFREDFITDLSPELIANLACLAGKVPQDQITNLRVESSMIISEGPDDAMIADTEKVSQFLQEQLAP
jgi:LCP family protein required for cell wall assembly